MLIAVSGMPGTGKSTLAQLLAARLTLPVALERIGVEHPWLDAYYASSEGRRRYALHSQLHFLSTAIEDLAGLRERGGAAVVDGTVDEDAEVFARLLADEGWMTGAEHDLYRRVYAQLLQTPGGAPPDVVVHLSGPLETIIERIRHRGRASEQRVERGYWASLHEGYGRWIGAYTRSPVVHVDVAGADFARLADVERLVARVAAVVGAERLPAGVLEPLEGERLAAWEAARDALVGPPPEIQLRLMA